MTNPLAALLGQAELTIADFGRRTAASIAEPLKAKGQEVVSEVVGAATAAVRTLLIKAALALVAGVMVIVAVVYAFAALYWALLPHLGPVAARLVMAGSFLVLAIVAVLAMILWPSASKAPGSAARTIPGAAQAKAAQARAALADADLARADAARAMGDAARASTADDSAAAAAAPMDLKSSVETLASILGDAGYRREQAGLRAGVALASQLKPMQIVALALIGGYVGGLRYRGRRR